MNSFTSKELTLADREEIFRTATRALPTRHAGEIKLGML